MRFDPGDYRHQAAALAAFLPFLWVTNAVLGPIDSLHPSRRPLFAGLTVAIGGVGFANLVGRARVQARQDSLMQRLKQIVPEFDEPWLFSEAKLIEYEGSVNTSAIWIITPDLSNDGEPHNSAFVEVVRFNLRRGVKYTYIYPDCDETKAREAGLSILFRSHPSQLLRCVVPQEQFLKLTISHIAIYNPEMNPNSGLASAFIEAPVGGPPHWIRVQDRQTTMALIGRYRRTLDSYGVHVGLAC